MHRRLYLQNLNSSRKWDVESIGELVEKYNTEIHIEKDIEKAYDLAKSITDKDDVVVCAGHFIL